MSDIMLIDDSRLVGMVVKRILEEAELTMVHCRTAAEVFGFQGKTSKLREDQPEIILLDIVMPDMDGLDVLRKLKSMKTEQHTPVLMISASASENNITEAMNRGATGFLPKPLNNEKLLKELAKIAADMGSNNLIHKLSGYMEQGRQTKNTHEELILGPANLNYMLEILDNDMDMLYELVNVFVEDAPIQLDQIDQALGTNDGGVIRRAAHTFKGSVSNLGAPVLTQKAFDMEKLGAANNILEAKKQWPTLKSDADELLNALNTWLKAGD